MGTQRLEADLYRTWAILLRQGNEKDRRFVCMELEKKARELDEEARQEEEE